MTNFNTNIGPRMPGGNELVPSSLWEQRLPEVVEKGVGTNRQLVLALAGPAMQQVPGYVESAHAVRQSLSSPERSQYSSLPVGPSPIAVMVPPNPSPSYADHLSPHRATNGIIGSGAVAGGAVALGAGGWTYFSTGNAFISAVAAMPALVAGALNGAGIYGAGVLHNVLWKKEGQQPPGHLGTFLRGIVAPLTVPVGLIRNLTWNRRGRA